MMKRQIVNNGPDDNPTPEWLLEALRISREAFGGRELEAERVSPAFRQRCQEAGELAFILAKLRNERQRIGFVPLSLASYMKELGRVAGVALDPVLAWLGVPDFTLTGGVSAKALTRLAKAIGLTCRETLVLLRISFAEWMNCEHTLFAYCRSNGKPNGGSGKLEECEARLGGVERRFDPETRRKLGELESAVLREYESEDQGG